jgi:signal transduction histidine kinase
MSLFDRICQQPRWLLLIEGVLSLVTVGWLDYSTGWEWSLFVFYAVPILFTVWCVGRVEGILLATIGAGIWWVANSTVHPYRTELGFNIATLSRFAYFVFVAVGGAALKAQRESDHLRIAALEKTRELENEIVRVSEDEQRRIGRDLHDGLCQVLAAINLSVKSLADDLEREGGARAADARQVETLLQDAIAQARGLARGLFPVQMEGAGLSVALDELASTTASLTGKEVTFTEEGDTRAPNRVVATQMYRIAQEALGNSLKHAQARDVGIHLGREGDDLILMIRDNGKGFVPHSMNGNGIGLGTMSYRAHSMGADLQIKSEERTGTVVTCRVPVGPAIPELVPND